MNLQTVKAGARFAANQLAMAARQDGYLAATGVGTPAPSDGDSKPRLAKLAVTTRSGSSASADHPVGYSEAIRQGLQSLPTRLKPCSIDTDDFHSHVKAFAYPKAYAGGPLDEGSHRENKLLEYSSSSTPSRATSSSTWPANVRSSPLSCAGQPARRSTART